MTVAAPPHALRLAFMAFQRPLVVLFAFLAASSLKWSHLPFALSSPLVGKPIRVPGLSQELPGIASYGLNACRGWETPHAEDVSEGAGIANHVHRLGPPCCRLRWR